MIIVVIALFVIFSLAILPAIRHDMHLAHRPGTCLECDHPEGES